MRLDRLQRVTRGGAAIAIIDHQHRAAAAREAKGAALHHRGGDWRGFDDRAGRRATQDRRDRGVGGHLAGHRDQPPLLAFDHALAPAVGGLHILMHRQRVEKFIGDDDRGGVVGHARHIVVMHRTRQPRRLGGAQRGAGFDEVDARRGAAEARHRAQGVGGEGAAAGAQLDIGEGGTARAQPQVGDPDPDQLAKHLADLGRSSEIARGAERVARRIIMAVRRRHIIGDGHRARRGDLDHQLRRRGAPVRQCCRPPRSVRRAGGVLWRWRRARCPRQASGG